MKKNHSMLRSHKKGQQALNLFLVGGILLVIIAVALSIGGQVMDQVDNAFVAGSQAAQIAGNGSAGLLNLSSQLPLTGTVLGLTVILLLLITLLFRQFSSGIR